MNQASILTLQRNAKGYTDFDELPEGIYVDTSAWICAYGSKNKSSIVSGNSNRGGEIADFLGECIASNVDLYHSELVLKEAVHANRRAHLEYFAEQGTFDVPRFANKNIDFKKFNEIIALDYPNENQRIFDSQNSILNYISENSILLPYKSDEESLDDFLHMIQATCGLMDTQDLTHVLTARSYGLNSFLVADGDFLYLDNDNIFISRNEKYTKARIGRANVLLPFKDDGY